MNFPFLASVVIFVIVLTRQLRRNSKLKTKQENDFWERERRADSVRRKPLDNLEYIHIPLEHLPVNRLPDNEKVHEYLEILHTLSEQNIVNLTGYSNTELKLEYGAPNLTVLTEYDQNYTILVRTLQQWADVLYREGLIEETCAVLEFALKTRTDVSKTYYTLAEIYTNRNESKRLHELTAIAESLKSVNRNAILRSLAEMQKQDS